VGNLRKYRGTGIFSAPSMPAIKGNFTLEFEDSGKYSMSMIPEDQIVAMKFTDSSLLKGSFKGTSSKPFFELEIETVYLSNVKMEAKEGQSLKMEFSFLIASPIKLLFIPIKLTEEVEFRRGLSNLLFYGTQMVQQGTYRVFGKTIWQLAGKVIILQQIADYKQVTEHLMEYRDVAVTCEIKMVGSLSELPAFTEISENLQNLFSLASANYITPMYEDVYFNGQISSSTLFPLKTYSFSGRPSLIDNTIIENHEFKDFIDTTYQNYVNLRNNMGLPYFIEFFTTSKMYSPLEVEYILSTTSFECLESYFRSWQSFRETDNLKRKITRMSNHFGFAVDDSILEPYRICRNSLTHEGKFPAGSDSVASTMALRNLIDRFVLTILGYRNKPYYNAITRNKDIVP
jgi:hypothetical protein